MWLCHTWGEALKKDRGSYWLVWWDLFLKSDDFSTVDNETGCAISREIRISNLQLVIVKL